MTEITISKAFGGLTDPRINRNLRHPLVNIITISICAIICGCDDFCSIEEYGNSKAEWLAGFLDLKHGIPSHDTFSDVLNRLKPKEFSQAFTQWVSQLGNLKDDIVSIDGKCMCRTLDKASGASAIHLVSAWSAKNNLCFGQIKVDEKSNEITAIPLLLDLLDLKGATVTMDAMGCQFAIADKIVALQADYVLALKGNQGEFHDDIKLFLETNLANKFKKLPHTVSKTASDDHGRIEQRNVWLTGDVQWLIDRHPRWKSIKALQLLIQQEKYKERYHANSDSILRVMGIRMPTLLPMRYVVTGW